MSSSEEIEQLPLIPEAVLKKYHCHQPMDGRYRAAQRLLQALFRIDRKLPMGTYISEDGMHHELGNKLSQAAGAAGCNFLSADIAAIAWREVAYREIGAMIDEERLATNMLSSMPLCFNIFARMKIELVWATSFLHELIPGFSGTATQVLFEHSPGRGDPRFTNDYSAFDVLIRYKSPEGRSGFVAFELKLAETCWESAARQRPRYSELSQSSGLYLRHDDPDLRASPLNQFFREHLLAFSMVASGLYDADSYFVVIAPELNDLAQDATRAYRAQLAQPAEGKIRFVQLTLEEAIAVIGLCDPDHAAELFKRYCDFSRIDEILECNAPKFGMIRKREIAAVAKREASAEFGAPSEGLRQVIEAPNRNAKAKRTLVTSPKAGASGQT